METKFITLQDLVKADKEVDVCLVMKLSAFYSASSEAMCQGCAGRLCYQEEQLLQEPFQAMSWRAVHLGAAEVHVQGQGHAIAQRLWPGV